MSAPITPDLVWSEVEKRLFAVLAYVNPKVQARSAGIVYLVKDREARSVHALDQDPRCDDRL